MKFKYMSEWERIVIKIGTNSIMKSTNEIDFQKLDRLAFTCSTLMQAGKEIVIVTSGAVGVGASTLDLAEYPRLIEEQQALAAVGQSILMGHYSRFFQYYGFTTAQILLTRDVVTHKTSYENVQRTIKNLLNKQVIPIINENDVIADDELSHQTKFGDNDTLSSIVSEIIDADLLILLSDVAGLYTDNPKNNPKAKMLYQITEITDEIYRMASGKGSAFATGGMKTKLKAAQRMLDNEKSMIITSSEDPSDLLTVLTGKPVGTLFSNTIIREE